MDLNTVSSCFPHLQIIREREREGEREKGLDKCWLVAIGGEKRQRIFFFVVGGCCFTLATQPFFFFFFKREGGL